MNKEAMKVCVIDVQMGRYPINIIGVQLEKDVI